MIGEKFLALSDNLVTTRSLMDFLVISWIRPKETTAYWNYRQCVQKFTAKYILKTSQSVPIYCQIYILNFQWYRIFFLSTTFSAVTFSSATSRMSRAFWYSLKYKVINNTRNNQRAKELEISDLIWYYNIRIFKS